jgi:hypothetical protein
MVARFESTGAKGGAGASKLKGAGQRVRVALASALQTLGPEIVAAIRDELRAVQPGLHPFTVARTGRTQPFVGTSIDEALTWRVEQTARGAFVWAGIPASAGEELIMLVRVHEKGATIPVTAAMRGYLHAQGLHLRPETAAIVIPPRPFIGPGFERQRSGGRARTVVVQHVARAIKGE